MVATVKAAVVVKALSQATVYCNNHVGPNVLGNDTGNQEWVSFSEYNLDIEMENAPSVFKG